MTSSFGPGVLVRVGVGVMLDVAVRVGVGVVLGVSVRVSVDARVTAEITKGRAMREPPIGEAMAGTDEAKTNTIARAIRERRVTNLRHRRRRSPQNRRESKANYGYRILSIQPNVKPVEP